MREVSVMDATSRHGDPIRPLDWLEGVPVPGAQTTSGALGWVGLDAVRCIAAPAFELDQPALSHHWFVQFVRPPDRPRSVGADKLAIPRRLSRGLPGPFAVISSYTACVGAR